ncbi:ferredoxin--NADP reductase [Streptomyces sp. NPDC047061]|uniref:ferredoxin--NADP reductase n=1 Tax=Streptomyces sp. NPDC047061 TaxID=3154605 RepID=UPI0033D4D1FD
MSSPIELRVVDVVAETVDAKSFVLEPPEPTSYSPGQFLTIAVPSEEQGLVARCYSLASAPHEGGLLTVTVKRTPGGYASNWLCDNVTVGQALKSLPPGGVFTAESVDDDLLLFAGGSGITPVISLAKETLARGSGSVALFYANRSADSVIFGSTLAKLVAEYPDRFAITNWFEDSQGLPTAADIRAFAEQFTDRHAMMCGPAPFMQAVMDVLKSLDFPRERRRQEKFVSLSGNPFEISAEVVDAADLGATVPEGAGCTRVSGEIDGAAFEFDDWRPGVLLLDFLLEKGIPAPFSCRLGDCSACACRVIEGDVEMVTNEVLEPEDIEEGIRLVCQSLPVTEHLKISFS